MHQMQGVYMTPCSYVGTYSRLAYAVGHGSPSRRASTDETTMCPDGPNSNDNAGACTGHGVWFLLDADRGCSSSRANRFNNGMACPVELSHRPELLVLG